MNGEKELVIPLSKLRILFIVVGAGLFTALGVTLLFFADSHSIPNPFFVRILAVALLLFFGVALIFGIRKLFDSAPGLVMNRQGILDNAGGGAARLIPWNEITKISVTKIHYQKVVTIHVRQPEHFMKKGHWLSRLINHANYKFFGSPIHISSNSLKTNFDELIETIALYHSIFKED